MKRIIFILCIFTATGYCQTFKEIIKNISIELGVSQNELYFQNRNFRFREDAIRNDIFIAPLLRLGYYVYPHNNFTLLGFFGYSQFGGKTKELSNGYKDKLYFNSLEIGLIPSYKSGLLEFGFGVKYNRHLEVRGEWLGAVNQYEIDGRDWTKFDVSDWFKKWSVDLGVRIGLNINHWKISGELWNGISNLEEFEIVDADVQYTQRNYRLNLGYVF